MVREEFRPFIGSSSLHNSVARGLRADTEAQALLRATPSPDRMVATLAADPSDLSIMERAEPTVVRGVTAAWRGTDKWSNEQQLLAHFGDVRFDLSADLSMSVEEYLKYAEQTHADFPYYIYEREYVGDSARIVSGFVPPPWIEEDLLEVVPDLTPRKCQQLFLLGGPRTGSQLHQDGHTTVGWNVCCFGRKRWVFLAPETDVTALGLDQCLEGPALWFIQNLPKMHDLAAKGQIRMFECIQEPGDLLVIPQGWHHAICNLETSCALAHTAVLPSLLARCWSGLFVQHPAFALTLQDVLAAARPDLVLPPAPDISLLKQKNGGIVAEDGGKGLRLPLKWERVADGETDMFPGEADMFPHADATRGVVFVHRTWLRSLVGRRPCAASILPGGGGRAQQLLRFHEHILALACSVRGGGARADTTPHLLCLLEPADGSLAGERAEGEVCVLQQHGLEVSATVDEGKARSWAAARRLSLMAVVGAHQGSAAERLAVAVAAVPGTHNVTEVLGTPSSAGVDLFVADGHTCSVGEELLAVPLASCLAARDADLSLVATVLSRGQEGLMSNREAMDDDEEEDEEQAAVAGLRVALVQAVQCGDARGDYWCAYKPDHFALSHMACWDEDSAAAQHARHSVAWRRVRAWRKDVEAQRDALVAARVVEVSSETFLWAALVVQSWAIATEEGLLLCPGVSAANHKSVRPSARVSVEGGFVRLLANGFLDAGDAVTVCYDDDADYLDVFERWGFFDYSSNVHTAEIVVPPASLAGERGEEWRDELVGAWAAMGCNAKFNSWWVPDVALEVCPLLCAVRAKFVSVDELQQPGVSIADILTTEIAREDDARRALAELISAHLEGYQAEAAGDAGEEMEAARALIAFERGLLGSLLKMLLRAG